MWHVESLSEEEESLEVWGHAGKKLRFLQKPR